MKLPNFRAPTLSDFPSMPPGMEEPMKVVSKQVQDLTSVLQGQASPQDNFDTEVIEVKVTHNIPFTVSLQRAGSRPSGASLIYLSDGQIGNVALESVAEKKVRLRVFLTSEDEGEFLARIIIWKGAA